MLGETQHTVLASRFRAKREQLEIFQGFLPESHGHDPALAVLCVTYSLDGGLCHEAPSIVGTALALNRPSFVKCCIQVNDE